MWRNSQTPKSNKNRGISCRSNIKIRVVWWHYMFTERTRFSKLLKCIVYITRHTTFNYFNSYILDEYKFTNNSYTSYKDETEMDERFNFHKENGSWWIGSNKQFCLSTGQSFLIRSRCRLSYDTIHTWDTNFRHPLMARCAYMTRKTKLSGPLWEGWLCVHHGGETISFLFSRDFHRRKIVSVVVVTLYTWQYSENMY